MTTVRAAISQTTWTGDKESMLDKHEGFLRDAAADGAQAMCFQELFYGPYFGITQDKKYYRYAEPADGPIVQRFASIAKELGVVTILPIYEEDQTGVYYNTTVVVDADGSDPGQIPQDPHPACGEVLGEVLLPPGQPRLPGLRHRDRQDRHLHLLRPALPRRLARVRPARRAHRVQPERDQAGLSNRLWEVEGPAAAVANGYFVLQPNRVGLEDNEYGDEAVNFYGTSNVIDPRGNFVGERGSGEHEELLVRDLDMDMVQQMRDDWQFYRDRRPETYGEHFVRAWLNAERLDVSRPTALAQRPGGTTMAPH